MSQNTRASGMAERFDAGEETDAEAWMRGVNNGSLPDAMEGAEMAVANSNEHEVMSWEIESAEYEPESHDSEEADR